MASTSKTATSKAKSTARRSTKPAAPEGNKPAERTGQVDTTTVDSSTPEVPTNAAGEIALPDSKEIDAKAAEDAAKEGDVIDDIQKAQEDSVRTEIDEHAAAVAKNPVHPEEEIKTAYLVGGEVPVNAPGTEGLERQ